MKSASFARTPWQRSARIRYRIRYWPKRPKPRFVRSLTECREILQRKLQRDIRHLSYPYGSAGAVGAREFRIASEVGYRTAVTTRSGVVVPGDADRLMQLPRITLDGTCQRERYLDVLVSGVAPAAWNGLRRTWRPHRPAWA